jgi:hypothetical protein
MKSDSTPHWVQATPGGASSVAFNRIGCLLTIRHLSLAEASAKSGIPYKNQSTRCSDGVDLMRKGGKTVLPSFVYSLKLLKGSRSGAVDKSNTYENTFDILNV